jgi:glycerate kinase
MAGMRLLVAPDKFRGTATAAEIGAAVVDVARRAGWEANWVPLADGGEGTLEALGGPNRTTLVSGPLGDPVEAGWRLEGRTAVIEMARASGLELVGGAEGNDPIAATTSGTGELISRAVDGGARRVIVTLGGSATTDGGFGAIEALQPLHRLRGVDLVVACDVRTRFLDAAEVFAPQKGASAAQVKLLRRRLERLAQVYEERYGVDVTGCDGAGAAGGLAGGLLALGATLVGGFDLVAEEQGLPELMGAADLVVTGEGYLDEQSFEGKVVGGVLDLAGRAGVPALVVCGQREPDLAVAAPVVSLVERFGEEAATGETTRCVAEVVGEALARFDLGDSGVSSRDADDPSPHPDDRSPGQAGDPADTGNASRGRFSGGGARS